MRNKAIFLIIFLCIFLFGIYSVDARECKYKYKGKELSLTFTKDTDTNSMSLTGCKYAGVDCNSANVDGYSAVFNFVDGALVTDDETCYESLNVCTLTVRNLPPSTYLVTVLSPIAGLADIIANERASEKFLGIFGSSLDAVTINDAKANEFDVSDPGFWENGFWTTRAVSCESSTSIDDLPQENYVYYCDKFVELYSEVRNAYVSFADCGDIPTGNNSEKTKVSKCRADALTEVNKATEKLKTTCNNIMQNASLSAEDGCIKSCLNAVNSVEVLKNLYIGKENLTPDCSLSGRLVTWISNIIGWIKYIVPVVVIILGILDFLRAIATNNDDAMKKAQGRFIKRLIAAALVFIVPFILDFILEKMGFAANGCDIIKELN